MHDLIEQTRLRRCVEGLYFAYRGFTAIPDRVLEKRGLNRLHHRVIYFVGRHPGLKVNDLLRILAVSKQSLNAPLRQLVAMGLVSAIAPKHDRRLRQLRLTGEEKKLEALLTGAQIRHLKAVFFRLARRDVEGWIRVLAALAEREMTRKR